MQIYVGCDGIHSVSNFLKEDTNELLVLPFQANPFLELMYLSSFQKYFFDLVY